MIDHEQLRIDLQTLQSVEIWGPDDPVIQTQLFQERGLSPREAKRLNWDPEDPRRHRTLVFNPSLGDLPVRKIYKDIWWKGQWFLVPDPLPLRMGDVVWSGTSGTISCARVPYKQGEVFAARFVLPFSPDYRPLTPLIEGVYPVGDRWEGEHYYIAYYVSTSPAFEQGLLDGTAKKYIAHPGHAALEQREAYRAGILWAFGGEPGWWQSWKYDNGKDNPVLETMARMLVEGLGIAVASELSPSQLGFENREAASYTQAMKRYKEGS